MPTRESPAIEASLARILAEPSKMPIGRGRHSRAVAIRARWGSESLNLARTPHLPGPRFRHDAPRPEDT